MALRRLLQHGPGPEQALPMDGRRMQQLAGAVGTLPRGRRQVRAGGAVAPAGTLGLATLLEGPWEGDHPQPGRFWGW
uniref:Uncharacterized protein n=1 Tax=Catharus ustulatus TaxID=91951 RepID=A0A8C3TTZ2_CATUS